MDHETNNCPIGERFFSIFPKILFFLKRNYSKIYLFLAFIIPCDSVTLAAVSHPVVFTQGIPYNGNPNAVLPCLDICMYVTS
jgi:hypothetical protein